MSLKLMTPEDVIRDLKQRLREGWLLLLGGPDAIAAIERDVYPPGTPKNRLFELYVMPVPVSHPLFLGKKTDQLRERLNNPPDFDRTLAFIFADETIDIGEGKDGCLVQQIYYPMDGNLDRAVEQLLPVMEVTAMDDEMEEVMQKAIDAATDIVVSELDCHPQDADYQQRRRYCRHLLTEYLKEQEEQNG